MRDPSTQVLEYSSTYSSTCTRVLEYPGISKFSESRPTKNFEQKLSSDSAENKLDYDTRMWYDIMHLFIIRRMTLIPIIKYILLLTACCSTLDKAYPGKILVLENVKLTVGMVSFC